MKKGFTLMELLAVIVILAIIASISIPIVLNIIKDTKENAILRSAEFYLDGVEYAIANSVLNDKKIEAGTYDILENGNVCIGTLQDSKCTGEILEVKVDGETPTIGSITIIGGKIKYADLLIEQNAISMGLNGSLFISNPKSFSEDSWDVIATNARLGNLSAYNIGDTKEVKLSDFTNTAKESGTYTVRIVNTQTPNECSSEGFSQTACGFVIEFLDIIDIQTMNSTFINRGGWRDSDIRSYINETVYQSLPQDLRDNIIETTVVSGKDFYDNVYNSPNYTTTDKLYLLASKEVYGISLEGDKLEETNQLDYYRNEGITVSNYSGATKKYNGSENAWWFRSANSQYTDGFYNAKDSGELSSSSARTTCGIAVAFRL